MSGTPQQPTQPAEPAQTLQVGGDGSDLLGGGDSSQQAPTMKQTQDPMMQGQPGLGTGM